MSDKLLYVLAGYDDAAEARLAGIQNQLYELGFTGFHTKNIPQHITLGSFPTEQEAELTALLRRVSAEVSPFEVTFNHIGVFGGARVLFVAPDPNVRLLNLKERFGDSRNWTPHTTMLIDDPDAVYKALPVVMEHFSAFSGEVTTLHLYEFFPSRHILTVHLGG